jgi:acyl-CoA hydrolase
VVAVVDTELPDAGNASDKINPVSQQIADNVVTFCWQKWRTNAFQPEFLPLQAAWAISTTR